jgi:hypothetical protein
MRTKKQHDSMSIFVVLRCLESGELCASIGIEGKAEMSAEVPEFGWIERHSDDSSTTTAGLIFALLGTLKPMGIPVRQKMSIFHHGLDFIVLLGGVPALSDTRFVIHDVLPWHDGSNILSTPNSY